MASLYTVSTGVVALTAASTKSLVLLNPVDHEIRLVQLSVSFDDTTVTDKQIAVELYRVVTIGGAAGSAGTVVKLDPGSGAATTTALTALGTEPTTVEVIDGWYVPPYTLFVLQEALGREPIALAAGQRLGVRAITQAAVAPNARCTLRFEE